MGNFMNNKKDQNEYDYQYCQKIVVLSHNLNRVLLAQRKDEEDFDGVYSLIGGKLESADINLLEGLKREKKEEIGDDAVLRIFPYLSYNEYYVKANRKRMVLPHYAAIYSSGEIHLGEEYSNYKWVDLEQLARFEPKIKTIPEAVKWAKHILSCASEADLVSI